MIVIEQSKTSEGEIGKDDGLLASARLRLIIDICVVLS